MVGLEQIQESGFVEAACLILMKKTYLGLDTIKVAKQLESSSKDFPKISWRFTQDLLKVYPKSTQDLLILPNTYPKLTKDLPTIY